MGDQSIDDNDRFSIIDLGFGCGDQSLFIQEGLYDRSQQKPLKAYVGITLENAQYCIAQERLNLKQSDGTFQIYCADAGRPQSWNPELRNAVSSACQSTKEEHENWILGLDSLYHFQPSRWPVIEHAKKEINASLMAFDLCIAEDLSMWQRLMVWLMALFGQSPFANWVTIRQYRERLVLAGYDSERIEIRDISEHVFGPLAGYLKRREAELERYGLSIGRFRYAAKMFAWWSRTGIVRGCIIVARR